jgi:hypothetical protein
MGKDVPNGIVLLSTRQLADPASAFAVEPDIRPVYDQIAQWITSYLMESHPDLGRSGEVCPFAGRAFRLDTIRIGVSLAKSSDGAALKTIARDCIRQFSSIPCDGNARHLRTIIVGFPRLEDEAGFAALRSAQAHVKWRCLSRGLMIGKFHPRSDDRGLWNRRFRPMRSPIPLLAVRHLVRNDAAFALRNPILFGAYLCRYSLAAPQQLLNNLAKQRARNG